MVLFIHLIMGGLIMHIGVPKEIKNSEFRVGITPAGVYELIHHGHKVSVQIDSGLGAGFSNEEYEQAGADILATAQQLYGSVELVVKVKEPLPEEYPLLNADAPIFTYFHLAADRDLTEALQKAEVTCVAYETVTDSDGHLPLLAPMSEVAGRMAIQAGAHCLEKAQGGRGILLGGVPGVAAGHVVIIGGGVVGSQAAQIALGMGAQVSVLDRSLQCLRGLEDKFGGRINTVFASREAIAFYTQRADIVVGAVLVPGAAAPKLINREQLKRMKTGSVIVDVAIDQGGCFETSKPTTHQQPTYLVDGVVHYCVANIPGAVPRTSTLALTNSTLPFVLELAESGVDSALANNAHLRSGLNIYKGKVTCQAVAECFGLTYHEPLALIT